MKQLFLLSVLFLGLSALVEVQTKPMMKNKKAFFKEVAKDLLKEAVANPHGEEPIIGDDTKEIADALADIVEEDCESVCPPAEDGDFGAHMIQCIQCIAEEFGTPMFPEFLESVLSIRSPELIDKAEEEEAEGEEVSEVEESDEKNKSEGENSSEELEESEEDKSEVEESELKKSEDKSEGGDESEEIQESEGSEDVDLNEFVGDGAELLKELTESFEESGVALFIALLGPCKDNCSSVTEPQTDPLHCLQCMTGHIADESAQFISSALAYF